MDKLQHQMKLQGSLFCLIAFITVCLSFLFKPGHSPAVTFVLALAILLLGVPHGSFDSFYGKTLFKLNNFGSWILFVSGYLKSALFIVFIWMLAPTAFFGLFLFFSALHFSEDLPTEEPLLTRIIYGGSIIVLPFIFYEKEVTDIFAYMIPASSAESFRLFFLPVSKGWVVGAVFSILHSFYRSFTSRARKRQMNGPILLCLVILSLVVPPLLAFTVYFCAMHSPRHIFRTLALGEIGERNKILRSAIAPTAAVLLSFIIAVWLFEIQSIEKSVLTIVFVGLAALTGPHMILLKLHQIRLLREGS